MTLDLTPLSNAVQRLQEGLARYLSDTTDTQIRDGLIQRFEFTYELSHKMLRRHLVATAASPTAFEGADFQVLIRSGSDQGLLKGAWPAWRRYREMRSRTSHTYDEAVALQVVAGLPDFLDDARFLLEQLQQRQGA